MSARAIVLTLVTCILGAVVTETSALQPDDTTRSNPAVLAAFRNVVRLPGKSTVRILANGKQVALGTIVDPAGLILTKASELEGQATCVLSDGSRYSSQVLATDRATDLALLKISADHLPAIRWSDEPSIAVGAWVATPGLDELPRAIGVISVKPHSVRGGVLGIKIGEDPLGPRVGFVIPDGGADKAGIHVNDVITHVGNQRVESSDALINAIKSSLPGQQVELTVQRNGQVFKSVAVLDSEERTAGSERASFQNQLGGPLSDRRTGFLTVLEHDSVLLPNQCGGALVNLNGEAVGINIARANRVSSYAIPASIVRSLVEFMTSKTQMQVSHENSELD